MPADAIMCVLRIMCVSSRTQKPSPLDALLGPPPVLVDVREADVFGRDHPAGAVNVPLYKPLVRRRMIQRRRNRIAL